MIRPLSVNLARRPFRNNTVYWVVFSACFAFLTAASAWNAWDYVRTGRELTRLDADLTERTERYMLLHEEVQKMQKDVARLNLPSLDARSAFANGLILSRFFSWSLLFDRLEEIIPPDVKIRSLRPAVSPKGIQLQIDGLTRNADALYEFETALDTSQFFAGVYPQSESTRENKSEINFDLVMDYLPGGDTGESEADEPAPATPTAGLLLEGGVPVAPGADPNAAASSAAPDDVSLAGAAVPTSGLQMEDAPRTAPAPAVPVANPIPAPIATPLQGGETGAQPVRKPRTGDPNDPLYASGDPASLSDDEFKEMFGEIEWLRQRGSKSKGKGKGKGMATSAPVPTDPNGATR